MWWSLMSRGRGAEERNSFSYENRHASDNVTLNEPRSPEPLNCDPTVDVEVVGTTRSEFVERAGLPVGDGEEPDVMRPRQGKRGRPSQNS